MSELFHYSCYKTIIVTCMDSLTLYIKLIFLLESKIETFTEPLKEIVQICQLLSSCIL